MEDGRSWTIRVPRRWSHNVHSWPSSGPSLIPSYSPHNSWSPQGECETDRPHPASDPTKAHCVISSSLSTYIWTYSSTLVGWDFFCVFGPEQWIPLPSILTLSGAQQDRRERGLRYVGWVRQPVRGVMVSGQVPYTPIKAATRQGLTGAPRWI